MKRISWSELTLHLDRLFFGGHIANQEQAEQRAETIDALLEGCGWTWDQVLEELCREQDQDLQTKFSNQDFLSRV